MTFCASIQGTVDMMYLRPTNPQTCMTTYFTHPALKY